MATTTLADTLQDYRAQLTGTENEAEPGHPTPTRVQVTARRPHTVSPPGWPQNYRRVPPFRPVNRNLDPAERPNGANVGEYVFVNVMLNGVRINSVCPSILRV